jgi:hypothetical protein
MTARSDPRRTKPLTSPGTTPLTARVLDEVCRAMPPDAILVGGQALAFWMLRYRLASDLSLGTQVTSDADLLGNMKDAEALHEMLGGRLVKPAPAQRTALVARLMLPADVDPGLAHVVDVVHKLYDVGGLRKSTNFTARVAQRAVRATLGEDLAITVMHPLDVLISRVNNAAGLLAEKGDHVITQAAWAVDVMRTAFLRSGSREQGDAPARVGAMVREVRGLAHGSAGRTVRRLHGIEVMDAVPEAELVKVMPSLQRQFEAIHRGARTTGRDPVHRRKANPS